MTDALDTKTKPELVKTSRNLRAQLSRMRDRLESPTAQLFDTVLSGAGGAGAGVLESKYPSIKGTFFSGGLVAGGIAAAVALAVKNPLLKRQTFEVANGLVAGTTAVKTYKAFEAKRTAAK